MPNPFKVLSLGLILPRSAGGFPYRVPLWLAWVLITDYNDLLQAMLFLDPTHAGTDL